MKSKIVMWKLKILGELKLTQIFKFFKDLTKKFNKFKLCFNNLSLNF